MREPERFDDGYRAFISYSHQDKDWGEWLHRALETYRVPKTIIGKQTPYGPIPERLTPIFRDRDELATADDLSEEITNALRKSQFLVVICSPAAAGSRWVNEEIKTFKRLHGEGLVRAVIVGGAPFSGDPETECFPEALRFKFDARGEMTAERSEPIAADLRPGGDGKKYALSKLVAGLTGAKLDELIQREHQRRNARMRIVAGGLGVVAAGMGALAANAVIARDEARAQRTEAIAARDGAEGLVEFMLTDLRKRLDAVGRLDVLDSVGERALAYYDARDLSTADPDALGRRARAQLLIGEMDNSRGDLDAALGAYEAAAATTGEQLRRDPDNEQRIFDHSQSVFWVGYIAWQRGDMATARGYFTQYYDQAKRLVELDPDNDDWQAELMYAHSNLGTLEMDQGDAIAAEAHFRPALDISLALLDKNPDDIDLMLEVGQSHAWLADALYRQSKITAARDARQTEMSLYVRGLVTNANHAALKNRGAIANYRLAQIELAAGQLDDALARAREAVTYSDQLLALEPNNAAQVDYTSLAHAILGEIYFHLGRSDEARQSLGVSITLAERLVAQDDSVDVWRGINLTRPRVILGRVQAAVDQRPEAIKQFTEIVTDLHPLIAKSSIHPSIVRVYCEAIRGRARLSSEFESEWSEVVSLLEPASNNHEPETLTILAEAYQQTGHTNEAEMIVLKLHAAGYRHPDFMALLAANPELVPAASGDPAPP